MANTIRICFFVRLLTFLLLILFCTPYTFFDEAKAYLADTENELVHYYLTPLPDNGEACSESPNLQPFIISSPVIEQKFSGYSPAMSAPFFHPPK